MVTSLLDLPDNALTEILARLPLTSLITANCVCRTFHRLISPLHSSYVIALHSANASPIRIYTTLTTDSRLRPKSYAYLLDPETDIGLGPQITDAIPLDPDWTQLDISNSCNGLVYLTDIFAGDSSIFSNYVEHSVVWNPLTNEYLELHTTEKGYDDRGRWRQLWLGFSPSSNHYKVLKILTDGPNVIKGRLFDVGSNSNSWRAIDGTLTTGYCQYPYPTYLDGVIYWTTRNGSHWAIEFFDFDREEFGIMDLPDVHYDNARLLKMSHGLYQGCLCLSCYFSGQKLVMWVMEKGNWGRKFIVDMMEWYFPEAPKLLHVSRNGEILMFSGLCKGNILCVNPKTNSLRCVKNYPFWIINGVNLVPNFAPLKDILKTDNIKPFRKRNSAILTHKLPKGEWRAEKQLAGTPVRFPSTKSE